MAEEDNKYRRMTDAEFAEAKDLYERGVSTLADLADKFAISRNALSAKFKKHDVVKGSRAAASVEVKTEDLRETYASMRPIWIEEVRMDGYKTLRQAQTIVKRIVVEAVRDKKPLSAIDEDLKAAQRFDKVMRENISATLELLEAKDFLDESELPTLLMDDLTQEEILDFHKATGVYADDATVEDMLAEEELLRSLE